MGDGRGRGVAGGARRCLRFRVSAVGDSDGDARLVAVGDVLAKRDATMRTASVTRNAGGGTVCSWRTTGALVVADVVTDESLRGQTVTSAAAVCEQKRRVAGNPRTFAIDASRAFFDAVGVAASGPGYCLALSYRGGDMLRRPAVETGLMRDWLRAMNS